MTKALLPLALEELKRRQKIKSILSKINWSKPQRRGEVIHQVMDGLDEPFSNTLCIDVQAVLWNEFEVIPVARSNLRCYCKLKPDTKHKNLFTATKYIEKFKYRVSKGDRRFQL